MENHGSVGLDDITLNLGSATCVSVMVGKSLHFYASSALLVTRMIISYPTKIMESLLRVQGIFFMYIIFFNLLFKAKCCPQLTLLTLSLVQGQIPENFWVLAQESPLVTSCLAPLRDIFQSLSRGLFIIDLPSDSLSLLKHLHGEYNFMSIFRMQASNMYQEHEKCLYPLIM